jgi:hypothetical protein
MAATLAAPRLVVIGIPATGTNYHHGLHQSDSPSDKTLPKAWRNSSRRHDPSSEPPLIPENTRKQKRQLIALKKGLRYFIIWNTEITTSNGQNGYQ